MPFDLIDTPDSLPALLSVLEGTEDVSIDTEADSFHHFHHKVCLIQLGIRDQRFIVDPLAKMDLSGLMDALAQKRLIFHDAGYDLRMMLADFDFRPLVEIFDTMLAARLVGLENVSLSALLAQIVGVHLSKHNQRANWAIRPIDEKLLAYAAEDIRYLGQLADHLREQLDRLGRRDWHREYCEWTIAQTQIPKTPEDPERIWRIRGTYGLSPRQMAFVRAVWQWRQDQSDRADVSPFRILRNEQLIDLALWAERQKEIHSDRLPRLPRHCKADRRRKLLEILLQTHTLGPEQWPQPLPRNDNQKPSADVLDKTDRVKSRCRAIAEQLNVEPQLIASRKSLLAAVNTGADTEDKLLRIGWMRWQAQLLLPALREVIN